MSSGDEEEGVDEDGRRQVPKLKTYDFKNPHWMKRLTNTYFKKSKASEKAMIMNRELTSGKLNFQLHQKNSKSLSCRINS